MKTSPKLNQAKKMSQTSYLKYLTVLFFVLFTVNYADECRKDVAQVTKENRTCPNSCSAIRPCLNIKAECVCDEPCGFVCLKPGLRCPELKKPKHGLIELLGNKTFQSIAIYECVVGYQLVGPDFRKCQSDGSWSGKEPFCIDDGSRCPELKEPEHGFIEHLGNKTFRSTATYDCYVGYQLVGPEERNCQSDGSWSGKEPFCIDEYILCLQPDFRVPNATFEPVQDEYDLGTEVTFKCETTLNTSSSSTTKCEYEDGAAVWTPINLRCLELQCDPPEEPENGRIIKQTGNKLNDTVQYECNEFTSTTDKMVSTCELEGDEVKWSEKPPECLKSCNISHLPFKIVLISFNEKLIHPKRLRRIKHGQKIEIICRSENHDMYLNGKRDSFILCWDGKLSETEIECRPYVECKHLISPINGFVITDEELRPQSVAKYECKDGYELIGPQNRTCQSDGNWTGIQPFCALKGIRCSKPDFDPLNAEIVSLPIRNNYFVGEEVIYRCKFGFKSGDNDVTITRCHERNATGIWFPWIIMNCQSSRCSDPEQIPNGFIEGDDYSFGQGISYQCNDDYKIKGFPHRVCMSNGYWSGSPPKCEELPKIRCSCSELKSSNDFLLENECNEFVADGQILTMKCKNNFSGKIIEAICKKGIWAVDRRICHKFCSVPGDPDKLFERPIRPFFAGRFEKLRKDEEITNGVPIRYSCENGYHFVDRKRYKLLRCINGEFLQREKCLKDSFEFGFKLR